MIGRKWVKTKGLEPDISDDDLRAMLHFLYQVDPENTHKWRKNLDKHRISQVLFGPGCDAEATV